MAIGKKKRISKSKKGGKKKVIDPFTKKEWYTLKAPSMFKVRSFGNTLCTKSSGMKLAEDNLKGRIYEVNLADLQQDEDQAARKVKLCCEEVRGKLCLTDFHGLDTTRDYLCSLIKKLHSLIEANITVKTLDGYTIRMFCTAFTRKRPNQAKVNCYAQTSQIKVIRKRMCGIMESEASKVPLRDLVKKLIPESVGKNIEKACRRVFPLEHVMIRKVKVLKKPKTDVAKLMELHGDIDEAAVMGHTGESVDAQNLLSAQIEA